MLNRPGLLEHVQQQGVLPPVHRPFVAALVINYVFGFPHYRAYVNEDMLAKMMDGPETTFDMMHEYALENLRLRTTSNNYQTRGLYDKTMVVCDTRDGHCYIYIYIYSNCYTYGDRSCTFRCVYASRHQRALPRTYSE